MSLRSGDFSECASVFRLLSLGLILTCNTSIALYEVMCRFVLPLCTTLPHSTAPTPVSSVTTIIDLEHVSLMSMWSLRHHLQEASTLATANYPETLNTIAVVNSPSFFPTVWGWIKVGIYVGVELSVGLRCIQGWFDEGTRNKIHVLGKDPGPTLRTLIEEEDLPTPYGGNLDWKFEDEPALDSHARDHIGKMPQGPAAWVDGKVKAFGESSSAEAQDNQQ